MVLFPPSGDPITWRVSDDRDGESQAISRQMEDCARRAVVAAVVERVDVFPAKRTGRAAFDPDEARIT